MPQAVLPDVNTSFIKWRNKIVTALESQNYTAVLGALNNFNACLDEKYAVHVSTYEYDSKLTDEKLLCTCRSCKKPQDFKKVKREERRTTATIEMLTRQKYQKVWICDFCGFENLINQTEFVKNKLPNPYFLGVVPDPPARKDGIMDRKQFHKKFEAWVWTFFGELEHAATRYRIDNWQKTENLDQMQISMEDEDEQ